MVALAIIRNPICKQAYHNVINLKSEKQFTSFPLFQANGKCFMPAYTGELSKTIDRE